MFGRGSARLALPFRRGTVLPVYVQNVLAATAGEDDEPTEARG